MASTICKVLQLHGYSSMIETNWAEQDPLPPDPDSYTSMAHSDNTGVRSGNATIFFACGLLCKRNAYAQVEATAFSELAGDIADQ